MRSKKQVQKDLTELSLVIFGVTIAEELSGEGCAMAINEQAYPMPESLVQICKDYGTNPWDLISDYYEKYLKLHLKLKKKGVKLV